MKNEPRATAFTDADVTRAWDSYIESHQSLHLLANAMRMSRPERKGDSDSIFTVTHSAVQIGFIREYLQDITASVRNTLNNDSITFEMNEVEEDSPLAWNDRELISHIIQDTPAVAEFTKEFQLKLI